LSHLSHFGMQAGAPRFEPLGLGVNAVWPSVASERPPNEKLTFPRTIVAVQLPVCASTGPRESAAAADRVSQPTIVIDGSDEVAEADLVSGD
jgi:hypothetical protein